jgi:hypothetical protein
MLDLIPLALTVIFIVAVVLTLSHVTHNSVAAVSEAPSKTKVVCPSATAANAAQSESVNEAARSGELDNYINHEYP